MPLTLTDFDTTGLTVPVLGLVTAGAAEPNGTNYRHPDNGGPLGSLSVGSDFTLVTGQSITRIALDVGGTPGAIRFWDVPSPQSFADYFTANPNLTLRFQTETAGPFELTIGGQGSNFSNWSTTDADAQTAISGISEGDDYILALAELATSSPAFADPTGDAQSWTANQAITSITVPQATGYPAPAYALVGTPPAGISFDVLSRVISGTPTAVDSGTITIRATNSEGSADWTVAYSVAAAAIDNRIYLVEVDWDGDESFANANANVFNDLVTEFYCYRGRSYGDMIYGRSEAGEMRITLDNSEGKYNRFNISSPLHNLVLPNRLAQFSIRDPLSLTHKQQWGGSLWNIEPSPGYGGDDEITLTCLGPLILLTQREISSSMRTAITTPDALKVVFEEANVPISRRGSLSGSRTMDRWWVDSELAMEAGRQIEETELGFILETKFNQISMQAADGRSTAARRTSKLILNADSTIPGIPVSVADPEEPLKDIANRILIPVRSYTVETETVLWSLRNTLELTANSSVTFIVSYPTKDSRSEAIGVDAWTAMVATTDYLGNSQADGAGSDLTSNMEVTTSPTTDLSTTRKIIVRNTGSTIIFVTLLQTRGQPVYEGNPNTIEVIDQPSIAEYEARDYTIPSQFISSISDAQSYGGFLLGLLKAPLTRVRVEFEASEYLAEAIDLDLSDRVTLILGGTEDYFIEGIGHRLLRGGEHYVELLLSSASVVGQVIVLGVGPPLGANGILAR